MYLKLLDSGGKISFNIIKAIQDILGPTLEKAKEPILQIVRNTFIIEMKTNPTYRDIINDESLRGALGIPNPAPDLDYLIEFLVENIDLKINKNKIDLVLLRPGYTSIADDARFIIIEKTVEALPWLKWLLTRGSDLIIAEYHVEYGPFKGSRTGLAVMRKGQFWSMPAQYAGVEEHNFVTQTFNLLIDNYLDKIFETTITKAFDGVRA